MLKRKKHHLSQRVTAILLTLLLAAGALPVTPAFAQDTESAVVTQESTEALEETTPTALPETDEPEEALLPPEETPEAAAENSTAVESKVSAQPSAVAAQAPKSLTVLHTNDMHGALVSAPGSTIGADETAGIREATEKAENTLLVDAGDATQGGTLAALSQGADVITLMNAAKYEAMALGNHEFDYGQEVLLKNAESADFPMLSANTVYRDTQSPILENTTYAGGTKTNNGQYILLDKNGLKVGIFGITTPETATKTNPKGIEGIEFKDVLPVTEDMIATLKAQGAEVIICLAHLGVDPSTADKNTSVGLAKSLPTDSGLDMIIDGHSHTVYEGQKTNGILIQQTGSSSINDGKITVSVENGQKTVDGHLISAKTAFETYSPDPAVTALADQLVAANADKLKPVIGNSRTALWGGTVYGVNVGRLGETNLGSLIADSMVEGAKSLLSSDAYKNSPYRNAPVVALENGGGVRATIKRDNITVGDSINVLPFGNTLAFKAVTPKILYEALENGVSQVVSQDPETGQIIGAGGCFPQISGMSFTYNPDKKAGERIVAIYLDGQSTPLDRTDNATAIVLASNDYEIAGGDGYTMLKGLPSVGEGGVLEEVFRDHLTRLTAAGGGSFQVPITSGRIKTAGAYVPKPYSAVIKVTAPESMGSLAGRTVEYQIDGGAVQTGVLDAEGVLKFDLLPDGPHGIRIGDADDVLVDNYCAIGTTHTGSTGVTAELKTTPFINAQPAPQPQPVTPASSTNPKTGAPAHESGMAAVLLTSALSLVLWKRKKVQ